MSEALAVPVQGVAKYTTDEDFNKLAKAADYLPRFQLYGATSKAVKKAQIPMAHYGFQDGEDITDCGNEVHCFVLGVRLKAMRIIGDKVETFFDPKHAQFIKIKEESGIADTGSLCGPEFLLYVPAKKQFTTFFMANKTMRREAPNVKAFMPTAEKPEANPMTLRVVYIEKNGYSWHGPVSSGCSLALDPPGMVELMGELAKFNNPPEPKVAIASAAEVAAQGQRAR